MISHDIHSSNSLSMVQLHIHIQDDERAKVVAIPLISLSLLYRGHTHRHSPSTLDFGIETVSSVTSLVPRSREATTNNKLAGF